MPLTENGFDVASENIQDQEVSEEMPGSSIEQHCGDELPRVSIVNTAIAQREIIADEAGLKCIEKKLGNETGNINADQRQQDNAPAFSPRPRRQ